jgi:tyrosine-protein kinase Etk/Wzc
MQDNQINIQNTNEESLISRFLFKYLPYWPLFVVFFLLSLGAAYTYLRLTNPKYEATATLIIKDEKKGYDDPQMMESLNMLNTNKIIENELEVLQSRTLMDTVVKGLRLYAPIFEDGGVKSTSAYLTSPVIIEAAEPDELVRTEKIHLQYDPSKKAVSLNGAGAYGLSQWVKTPFGTLRFSPNQKYKATQKLKPLYFNLLPPKEVAQDLLNNLTVTAANKLSTIVDLSFKDEVPERGEDVLNELIRSYNFASINEKNSLAQNTLAFLEERLNGVARDLDSIERKIQQYKSGRGAIDISTQGQLFLENVSTNDQKLSDVNMQLAVLDQVERFVTSKANSGGIVPSTLGVSDPVLSQLLDKLYASELEYEKLKSTVAENNPLLVSVTNQINKIRPSILENIKSQRRSLQASRGNLNSTNSNYNSMLQSIPAKERQLLEISREQSIKNGIYSFLLQKREESALSFSSKVSDSRIVDKAQASILPVSPNRKSIYLLAIFAPLALVIFLINIRELLSGKVLYRKDLEGMTSFPILGEVAYQKEGEPIVIQKGKRTFIAEEFRKLRVSLPFLGISSSAKKILVTSSIPGEGKSFVASNLAVSIALTGKKVALVDLDLNNPSIGTIFGIRDGSGVTEYLKGEVEEGEFINPLDDYPNLFFIPTGSLPENPSELLSNGRVEKLIAYLEKAFDYVVIDTAPVVPVTDAYMVSNFVDATLYVVRHKYTPKAIVKRLDENNKVNPLTNPAIVFNGVKPRGFFGKNYGYGYGYGYVYDYKTTNKKSVKSFA